VHTVSTGAAEAAGDQWWGRARGDFAGDNDDDDGDDDGDGTLVGEECVCGECLKCTRCSCARTPAQVPVDTSARAHVASQHA
jgi:hypothetical protein